MLYYCKYSSERYHKFGEISGNDILSMSRGDMLWLEEHVEYDSNGELFHLYSWEVIDVQHETLKYVIYKLKRHSIDDSDDDVSDTDSDDDDDDDECTEYDMKIKVKYEKKLQEYKIDMNWCEYGSWKSRSTAICTEKYHPFIDNPIIKH